MTIEYVSANSSIMLKIFIDFDGTITRRDVGDAMFESFGGIRCSEFIDEYRMGALSAIECFRKECEACGDVDKEELDAYLDSQEMDPAFAEFIQFCRSRALEYFIVSDGMDYYISRILRRHGLGDIPFFANSLDLVPVDGSSKVRFAPSFPYRDEVCDRCACCKRNHMLTLSGDDDVIVYIGEGFSDRCPVRYADIVFAKDDLLKYCQQENISFFEYASFADVIARLEGTLTDRPGGRRLVPGKRRRAELARRQVYTGG